MCFPSVVFLLFEINSMNKFFRSHFGSRLKDLARLGLWCVLSSLVVFLIFYLSHLIQWIFSKIQWIFTEIRPARSRLYQRIFEFFLRVRWERAFNSQFLKEKRQNSKKKREKNLNENCKNHDFCGFFDFEVAQKRPYQRVFEFFLRDDVECSQISALVKK